MKKSAITIIPLHSLYYSFTNTFTIAVLILLTVIISNSSSVSSAVVINQHHQNYNENDLNRFRNIHGLRKNVDLDIQTINTVHNTIFVNDKEYSLNNLKPMNIIASDATYTFNGIQQQQQQSASSSSSSFVWSKPTTYEHVDNISGDRIVVQVIPQKDNNDNDNDDNNMYKNIRTIDIITPNGQNFHLASIVNNVMAIITDDMRIVRQITNITIDSYTSDNNNNNNNNNMNMNNNRELLSSSLLQKQNLRGIGSGSGSSSSSDTSISTNSRSLALSNTVCTDYHIIDLAMAYDSTFCASEGGQIGAEIELRSIVEKASALYEAQGICTKLSLVHVEGYCDSTIDPFTEALATNNIGCNGRNNGVVQWFGSWVKQNPLPDNASYDTYHLLYYDPNTSQSNLGCANQFSMCNHAHGAENMSFDVDIIRRAPLLAHEIGHNLGTVHVDDVGLPDYIMEDVGFTDHIWSPSTLRILQDNIPNFHCIDLESSRRNNNNNVPSTTTTQQTQQTWGGATLLSSPSNSNSNPISPSSSPSIGNGNNNNNNNEEEKEFQLSIVNTNLCINVPGLFSEDANNNLKLWTCNKNRQSQRFIIEEEAETTSNNGLSIIRIRSSILPTKCITLVGNNNNNVVYDDIPIRLYDCLQQQDNNSSNTGSNQESSMMITQQQQQQWIWTGNSLSTDVTTTTRGKLKSKWKTRKCIKGGQRQKRDIVRITKCQQHKQGQQGQRVEPVIWNMKRI